MKKMAYSFFHHDNIFRFLSFVHPNDDDDDEWGSGWSRSRSRMESEDFGGVGVGVGFWKLPGVGVGVGFHGLESESESEIFHPTPKPCLLYHPSSGSCFSPSFSLFTCGYKSLFHSWQT